MKATITGIDSLSKRIMLDLDRGTKVSDIPEAYAVSLDQAKRLSRYLKILKLAHNHLDSALYEKVGIIGLKVLPLARLFKQEDWEGLTEILSTVTDETTRDELELMIRGLWEKRQRIRTFKEEADYTMQLLEEQKRDFRQEEKQLRQLQQELEGQIRFFKTYPKSSHEFLLAHVGLYKGRLVLAKRLDVNWQRELKKKAVLRYDPLEYVFYIDDLEDLVIAYEEKLRHGKKHLWDYETDSKKIREDHFSIPKDGRYNLPTGVADLRSAKTELDKELKEIRKQQKQIAAELKKTKTNTVRTYMESVEAINTLSVEELKKHNELQSLAMKWLYSRGYIVVSGFILPNNRRTDVFAYNDSDDIVIVEMKVSQEELVQDKTWLECLNYCDEFYFLTPSNLSSALDGLTKECGHLIETPKGIQIKQEDLLLHKVDVDRTALNFKAGRMLAKKFVYGY
ncbi:MmcB family DNA repair protein [Bacillus sp. V5-8f]|uniref:MmcB family DNA repair protein n=1 Tax=Bacillus sp. V5-8f TaxID=2053044 RepID=UPI000C76B1F3|nr:MmcB family DNA repair protein [Bacillus sp. V5-8f]PLT33282.1 hypothetical protein CUU64_14345 [Bacillus sp. V5-8f]